MTQINEKIKAGECVPVVGHLGRPCAFADRVPWT
jgi:hypothetical protein